MEYAAEKSGSTVCPASSGSIVSLLKATGIEDLHDSLATGDGVIYGIQLDATGDTVSFQVNNIFAATTDIYVRHDITDDGSTFLHKDCIKISNVAPCMEPLENSIAATCRNKQYALVHLFFATSDESVVLSPEDATIPNCCGPDSYDQGTIGVAELLYVIHCSCPNSNTGGRERLLRGIQE